MVHGASFAPTRTRATSASLARSIASALGAEASDGGERAGDAIDGPAGSEPASPPRGVRSSRRATRGTSRRVGPPRVSGWNGAHRTLRETTERVRQATLPGGHPDRSGLPPLHRRARGRRARGETRRAHAPSGGRDLRSGPSFQPRERRTAAPEISRARAEDGRFRSFPRHSTRARGRRACRTARAKPTRPSARRHRDER